MPRRIAIIKPSALGDIVHALPVLCALRRKYHHAHITWIVNRSFESLIQNHPDLDATLPFDRGAFKNILSAATYSHRFAQTLRQQRFDLVIDLQGLLRTGLMTATTGAPRKIGFANAREGSRHFYTEPIEVPDAHQIHAVDRYMRIAQYLGCDDSIQFRLPAAATLPAALTSLPRPWYAVAVGAKWVTKRWPPASFGSLLHRSQQIHGGTAVFLGTADDTADSLVAASALSGPWLDLTGKTPLPSLAAVLKHADVMVANDTGPLHLAAALGTPCVAPYTCTKTILHGPYGQRGGVETSVPCGGSYLKKCPNDTICFTELTPDRLWPTLQRAFRKCA